MQQAPVRFTEEALSDLEDIFFLLVDNGAAVETGLRYLDRIKQKCKRIGDVPNGYPLKPKLGAGIRTVPFERSATIIYRVVPGSVEIIRIFYGGRDYDTTSIFE
jgi:toxin ParE1/3/4